MMPEGLVGRRILVVEDEMLNLMYIEMALEGRGCSAVCAAASVEEALALLDESRFDAAILDVNLGGQTSYPVAEALARLGVPFAFSTGYSNHGDRVEFNARPVLRKPYSQADLVTMVAQLVSGGPVAAAA